MSKRAPPRSSPEIFQDLSDLMQAEGSIHEISAMVYRDFVLTVDTLEGRVIDPASERWSLTKLNKNELTLLLGLAVKSGSDRTYSIIHTDGTFPSTVDALLREFHDRLLLDMGVPFGPSEQMAFDKVGSVGPMAREAIYYGAESFYLHQLYKFSRLRYRNDGDWLLQNAGISIRPIVDIVKYITDRINLQISAVGHMRKDGYTFNNGELTTSLSIPKDELRTQFGSKIDAFIEKFSTPATNRNKHFQDPFSINEVGISPLIDLGEYLYVPNQYRLSESVYESPFYWMMDDKPYLKAHAEPNRGTYLEKTTARIFSDVFGKENVFQNVIIGKQKKSTGGEIDVLVVFGEFVLVVQAKSKRITIEARAGEIDKLEQDFEAAIQSPYRQAIRCCEMILDGKTCETTDGREVRFGSFPRLFPVVVLSDPFPASTLLSRHFLDRKPGAAPVVWDIAVLDCVAQVLPNPIELIFYLKCRSDVFENVFSDSEYNYLGYHVAAKLSIPPELDGMMLDREFACEIDDYMISKDLGIDIERPIGILERAKIPIVSELLAEIKDADLRIAAVVVDLYDFSSDALFGLSEQIARVRADVSAGKAIKAFSIPTKSGGITYAAVQVFDVRARAAAESIGAKHKYDTNSDRWYVIVDSVTTSNPVDGLLPLVWPWEENDQDLKKSNLINRIFNSWKEPSSLIKRSSNKAEC